MNYYRCVDRSRVQFDFLYFTERRCDFDAEIESLGGKIYRLPTPKNQISRFLSTWRFFRSRPQINAVHVHTLFDGGIYLFAAWLGGVKVRVAHAHSSRENLTLSVMGRAYQLLSIRLIRWWANRYAACGHAAGTFLFGGDKGVRIIRNGIDIRRITDPASTAREDLKRQLQLSADCTVLCQIGRLDHQKNPEFAVEVLQVLRLNGHNYHLIFIGKGGLLGSLEATVRERDLGAHVSFLGSRADVPQIMAGSDTLLMPSRYEGFPLVLVESQTAGLPAIVSTEVSEEVDLGVGLIRFLPLTTAENWAVAITHDQTNNGESPSTRQAKLKAAGYDIEENIRHLLKLYALPS